MNRDSEEPRLPDSLIGELARSFQADTSVPMEVDRAILNRARAHLAGRGRLRLLLRTAGAVAAVAAIVAIVIFVRPGSHPTTPLATSNGDINGDGIVDIRDALLLARQLDAGSVKGQDVNHDGVTDRRDVDAIAMLAVRLDRGAVR